MSPLRAAAGISCLVAACGGAKAIATEPAGDPSAPTDASTSPAADGATANTDGPYAIECPFHFGPTGTARLRSDRDDTQVIGAGTSAVTVRLAPIADSAGEALLTVATDGDENRFAFRLSRTSRPPYRYIGGHGFTGLLYVHASGAPNLQLWCEAKPLAGNDPPPSIDADAPPLPFAARCSVTRTDDAGALVDGGERTVRIDGTDAGREQTADLDAVRFGARLFDDPYEGRTFSVGLQTLLPDGGIGVGHSRLMQLHRQEPLPNQLGEDHGFTGMATVQAPMGGAVSYVCATTP